MIAGNLNKITVREKMTVASGTFLGLNLSVHIN